MHSALVENLRAMCAAIMGRSGARQSKRYWGVQNPSFKDVAKKTRAKCMEVLALLEENVCDCNWNHLQETLLVGLQVSSFAPPLINTSNLSSKVLIPPIRGKPFQTLTLEDKSTNSVQKRDPVIHFSCPIHGFHRLA